MAESNQARPASRTAMATAYLRGAHQLLDATPRILEDPVAVPILGQGAAERIVTYAERYRGRASGTLRSHVVLRSRYAEDRLLGSLHRGIEQYVLLGAGFDTFAYRQPTHTTALRVIEVDQHATQREKLARLADARIDIPRNVLHAAVDFERTSLAEGLALHGITPTVPTFFSWLGVTMYLTRAAIDATLRTVARYPEGSEIVLTFAQPTEHPSHSESRSADIGERWLSHFTPDELRALLHACGFSAIEFLEPDLAASRYYSNRPADLPVPTRTSIVSAIR